LVCLVSRDAVRVKGKAHASSLPFERYVRRFREILERNDAPADVAQTA
jgi:predicted DNA binding CopG/RHH family protein